MLKKSKLGVWGNSRSLNAYMRIGRTYAYNGVGGVLMHTPSEASDLVVWARHGALEEAKSLFAPFGPTFQTVPCATPTSLGKTQLSVLYLSSSEKDASVEKTLAELRSCKVTTL